MDGGSLNLSDLVNPDEFTFDLPDLPDLTLEDLMGELDLSISPEGIKELAGNLLAGYNDYAVEHPEADYSRLDEYFMAYLQTPEAQQILEEGIKQIKMCIRDSHRHERIDPLVKERIVVIALPKDAEQTFNNSRRQRPCQ